MLIIPAIDIRNGRCVRLTQGDFSREKIYSADPVSVAKKFEKAGAKAIHIVDLDGARTGLAVNEKLIRKIRQAVKIPLELGGGIREKNTAARYLGAGIDRIIVGTKALQNPAYLKNLIDNYTASRIMVSLDIRDNKVAIKGWEKMLKTSLEEILAQLKKIGVTELIVTDIVKDGTLTQPNYSLLQRIKNEGFNVTASGGVSSIESIKKLQKMSIPAAIVGKALYEKKLDLKEAIAAGRPLSNLTKRIIPCLDVADGRVVKGVNFKNLRDAGDAVELGKFYQQQGADELVYLDINASKESRATLTHLVEKIAAQISIPFTVGGGVSSVSQIRELLKAGADKVSLNTAAIKNPQLINEAAAAFGSQCIVVAIDAKKVGNIWRVFVKGGSVETKLDAVLWAQEVEKRGAGEILLTSIDRDGTEKGYDIALLQKISGEARIPVIASGGASTPDDILHSFEKGAADAALAAGIFHYGKFSISEVKRFLSAKNIPIRL